MVAIEVGVAVEVGLAVGVGVVFKVLTSTMPSFILVVMGWIPFNCDGLLRIVPSIEIGEVPVFRTLKLIVTKTPFPFAVTLDNKASLTV